MSEELALGDRLLDGSALNSHQHMRGSLRVEPMDRLCEHILSGARFAFDENGSIADVSDLPSAL